MPLKKCLICEEEAKFGIKHTKDYYCEECAEDQFGDLSYLVKIEEVKQQEKNSIKKLEKEQEILQEE